MGNGKIIGVIGPNYENCSDEIYSFGIELGRRLSDQGFMIVCGGREGIMEAVCRGARLSGNYNFPRTIGVIPGADKNEANEYCDIIIPTGIGLARNSIIVNTADLLIAVAGGSGTLSEIAFAWQFGRKVICVTLFEGWAKMLAGNKLDQRNDGLLLSASSLDEVMEMVTEHLHL